jgi:hypothetical protein
MCAMTLRLLIGIAADQVGHRRIAGRLVVDEVAQAQALEEGDAPAVSWWSVRPPRCAKPAKLNVTSVGVLQFIPGAGTWHDY